MRAHLSLKNILQISFIPNLQQSLSDLVFYLVGTPLFLGSFSEHFNTLCISMGFYLLVWNANVRNLLFGWLYFLNTPNHVITLRQEGIWKNQPHEFSGQPLDSFPLRWAEWNSLNFSSWWPRRRLGNPEHGDPWLSHYLEQGERTRMRRHKQAIMAMVPSSLLVLMCECPAGLLERRTIELIMLEG